MSWLSELCTVYDRLMQNDNLIEKPLPLYHTANNAPLIITLNGNGNFCSAELLDENRKKEWQTCMPCTEKSSARTSGIEPYPFCDKLEYVAKDYANYAVGKDLEEKHEKYFSLLEAWANSEYSNQKIKSVYNYVKKGTLIADILKEGNIPGMNNHNKIANKENNVFLRWKIEIHGEQSKTWLDNEIQRLWIEYYSKVSPNELGFCYVSGESQVKIRELHPQKIRNSGDGAKLISSNDEANFTFRGRFVEATEACQTGMDISEKAHSALRYLIRKQGTIIGSSLTIVAWCSASDVSPQPLKSTNDLDFEEEHEEKENYYPAERTANAIKRKLCGYYDKIQENDKILVMALNSASPGRMAILTYREFIKTDFYTAQEHWHGHLAWFYTYWKDKKPINTISAPSPYEIIITAYGEDANDKVVIMGVQRLLSCILEKTIIPFDIEKLCFARTVKLNTLDKNKREKTLETACSVIRYNLYNKHKEDYTVGLEKNRKTRDYLYGRLLAVADRVESQILHERKEDRDTNAVRYMQRFVKYPCSTWKFLYADKLRPYFSQLEKKRSDWYESLIQEITIKFERDDFVSEKALSGEFLLGYHCQQKEFWDEIAKIKSAKMLESTNQNEKEEN